MVIHGGIDGYSRTVVYLHCSDNNRATTVLSCFTEAILSYGVPSRVRLNRGDENVMVANFMLSHPQRGTRRGSFITGRSVHNARIERLWRDVFSSCIFYHLVELQELDMDNELHIFCLYHVFLPKINASLHQFQQAWNNHPPHFSAFHLLCSRVGVKSKHFTYKLDAPSPSWRECLESFSEFFIVSRLRICISHGICMGANSLTPVYTLYM